MIIALFLVVVFANIHPHPEPISTHTPKTYKVNAEDPPLTRWAPIIKDYKAALDKFMFFFDLVPFSKTFFKDVDWYAHN